MMRMRSNHSLENVIANTNPLSVVQRGGAIRSWATTASGQSVSISGSDGSPETRSEAAMPTTPACENTFLRLNHLDIHADDAGNKKKRRSQRATGGDKGGRGLRQFSMKVCEKVEIKGRTTYNEVADELVAEFADPRKSDQAPDQQQYDEKNIRRRVYDALNVLMAMDIISKDKKEIQWRGLPRSTLNDIKELKSERLAIKNRIDKKAAYLRELENQRNEQLYGSGDGPRDRIALPFILVQTRPHATIEVEISGNMQLVHLDFNSTPFKLHDDTYVLDALKFGDGRNNACIEGGVFRGGDPVPPRSVITHGWPPPSPPLPGILKGRFKHEH